MDPFSCIRKRKRDAEEWCTQGVHAFNVKLKIIISSTRKKASRRTTSERKRGVKYEK
jgi:hypothetical protein